MKKNFILLFIADCAILSATFYLAFIAVYTANGWDFSSYWPVDIYVEHTGAYAFSILSYLFSFYLMGLYENHRRRDRVLPKVFFGTLLGTVTVSLLYFFLPHWRQGRTVLLLNALFAFACVYGYRKVHNVMRLAMRRTEEALLVGDVESAGRFIEEIRRNEHEHNLEITGVIGEDAGETGKKLHEGVEVVGSFEDIDSALSSGNIRTLVIMRKAKLPAQALSRLLELKFEGVKTVDAGHLYVEKTGKVPVFLIDDEWWLTNEGFSLLHSRIVRHLRRLFDFLVALVGLVCLSPVFLAVSLLVKMTSRGPVFFRQERVGERDRVFTLIKFRTMVDGAEDETGPVWSGEKDPRVTPLGRLLRRSRLDELPQLVNVLKGEMSLIGPRPERPEFVRELEKEIPYYGFRHMVRPGLTGWAQVNYPYGSSVEDAIEKLQYDLYYIQEMSLWLDVVILMRTLATVIRKKGS